MPSAVTCDMIITSASTRADGSLGLKFATPELDAASKTVFFELLNKNVKVLIQPIDSVPEKLKEIKSEFDKRSPSQRLRNVLYLLHKQQERTEDFSTWYLKWMESAIDSVKAQLEPNT